MKKLFYKILERLTAVPNEIPKLRLHVSDTAISFEENYISSVMEFDGIVFEAISNNVLENDFEALNLAYAETAKEKAGRLSFHCYQLRRKIDTEKHYEFDNKFCGDFAKKYLKRFNDTDYYANRFYIVFTLKYDTDLDEAINELEAVCDRFAKTLSKYEPKMLSVYTNQNGILCSQIWEFFYEIINSEQSVGGCPITGSPAYDALPASNLHFGFEILQIKGVLKNRFVALCDLKDFPFTTKLGMFNTASLALPFEYNFVQSFVALSPVKSLELIDRRLNELRSVKDKAQHQQTELELAQGYIQSGEMALGGYHAVLAIFGETQKEAMTNAISAMASFSNNAGAIFRKSTASAPASYFSQLPNYWYVPRKMMKSSRNRGMDIFIRALDGDYFAIEEGRPTGINPFQFEDGPKLRDFLNDLVVGCANDGSITCTSEEQNQIKNAIDTVMSLPVPLRRFSALLQSIPARGGNELHARLLKWCNTEENQGRFAWVLDNPVNQFDPDDFKIVGFDVGSILKENYQPTEPLLACLLYLKSQMVKKHSLLCTVVEEFWLPLKYKTPQEMMLDVLKTGRKRGEFMILVTQSPEEAVNSPIFPAIVQQTPTKILLPNPDAEYKNEQGGGYSRIGLTQKEFIQLQRLALDSRTFLIKQGHQSSFGVLDLYGFDDEISVLSGTTKNVELLDEILTNFEKQPISDVWLPIFYEARRQKKMGVLNTKELVYQHLAKAS